MIEGSEFFVILLVALIVVGPERLPALARKLGTWTAELRRAATELRQGLESEVGDVREIARDIREPLREVQETVRETKHVIDADLGPKPWVGPKPLSGPTPEDAMADLERINAGEVLSDAPTADQEQPEPSDAGPEHSEGRESQDSPERQDSPESQASPESQDSPQRPEGNDGHRERRAEGGAA